MPNFRRLNRGRSTTKTIPSIRVSPSNAYIYPNTLELMGYEGEPRVDLICDDDTGRIWIGFGKMGTYAATQNSDGGGISFSSGAIEDVHGPIEEPYSLILTGEFNVFEGKIYFETKRVEDESDVETVGVPQNGEAMATA